MNLGSSSRLDRIAWILTGLGLLFVLLFHLVPGLLAGMLVYSLLHRLDRQLRTWRVASRRRSRAWAVIILGSVGLLLAGGLATLSILAWKARATALPDLLARMAHVLDSTRTWLGGQLIPEELVDADGLRDAVGVWLQGHAEWLRTAGGHAGKVLAHILAGLMVGLLAAFHHADPEGPRPLAASLAERLARLLDAFERVVYAQVRISALNTGLTAVFLYLVLPLFGVKLPLRFTLVAVTFLAGLLPVIGNLLSNTAIVLISLGVGPTVAVVSLVYLIVIHKLEYLLNARIVGDRIQAQAWEVLASMILMEVAFGTPGLVIAPVLYAYLKGELRGRGLV